MRRNRSLWPLSLAVAIAAVLVLGQSIVNAKDRDTKVAANPIAGTGTLSGTVKATKEFKAAKVYATNQDNHTGFMVYTLDGRYRFIGLFPGNYEVSVGENGFSGGDPQRVTVKAGENATADFTLQQGPWQGAQGIRPLQLKNVKLLGYDELYPAGEGRELIERTCMHCHGPDFIPGHQWDESQWNAAIDLMSDTSATIPGRILPGTFTTQERQDLVAYLAKNYGPDATLRGLETPQMPVDEQVIGKSMYVEYHLPPIPSGRRGLHDSHFDNQGNIWYVDRIGLQLGKLDPRTAKFIDYPVPDKLAQPHGLTMDHEGHMWFTSNVALGEVDPSTGEMTLYDFGIHQTNKQSHGHTPVVDSKDNVWFTASYSDEIGKWDHETKKITMYKVPTRYSFPYALVLDKNDKLWMAEWSRCKVVKFDPENQQFIEYSPLTRPCTMRRLSVDHKGTVWYALDGNGIIGKLDPVTTKITEYEMPVKYGWPYDIQPDKDDNLWISDSGQGGALVKFDPKMLKFTYYPSPQRTDMPKIELTRDGAIWYTTRSADSDKQAVGVLYPDISKVTSMAPHY